MSNFSNIPEGGVPATYENMRKYVWTDEWIEEQGWAVIIADSTHWDTCHSTYLNISDVPSRELHLMKHAHVYNNGMHSIARRVQSEEARLGILRDLENAKGTKTDKHTDKTDSAVYSYPDNNGVIAWGRNTSARIDSTGYTYGGESRVLSNNDPLYLAIKSLSAKQFIKTVQPGIIFTTKKELCIMGSMLLIGALIIGLIIGRLSK